MEEFKIKKRKNCNEEVDKLFKKKKYNNNNINKYKNELLILYGYI